MTCFDANTVLLPLFPALAVLRRKSLASPIQALGMAAKDLLMRAGLFLQVTLWTLDGLNEPYPKSEDAWFNTVQSTSWRHLTQLIEFQELLRANVTMQAMTLADALLYFLKVQLQHARSPWQPQTFYRYMTSLHGAFSSLGKYASNTDIRVRLTDSSTWSAALNAWRKKAAKAQPGYLPPATWTDVLGAIELEPSEPMAIYLMILWLICGRKGDAARLLVDDVSLHENGRMEFFIQSGKGVEVRNGKYRVTSHCPPQWRERLTKYLAARKEASHKFMFPPSFKTSNEANVSLRRFNPALSTRSVRRGALQVMAASPKVSIEDVREMAGHTNVKTTYRYLGWGKFNEKAKMSLENAAKLLCPALPKSNSRPTTTSIARC